MADSRSGLPEFDNPPVIEVALSVQFKSIESLRSPHYGLLWGIFRDVGFSRVEEHATLLPAFEDFGSKRMPHFGISVQTFDDAMPPQRLWLLNQLGTELIQVQPDRLIVNWRRGNTEEPYPRYGIIRNRFELALSTFIEFIRSEKLGEVEPNQCEVTYVNHIVAGEGWSIHGEVDHVATVWQNRYSDPFLGSPEDVAFVARYRMLEAAGPPPVGRLHVSLEPALRSSDKKRMFVLTLTARGAPFASDLAGLFKFLDLGHEWIVRGFTSITTVAMHEIWRRKNGN